MSTRRNLRLRREYLYRKSLEGKERELYDRKKRIQKALAEGKAIPTELRDDAQRLKASLDADDDETEKLKTHIDDEYAKAGMIDPKICVTTSRSPSSRLKACYHIRWPRCERAFVAHTRARVGAVPSICPDGQICAVESRHRKAST